MSTHQLLDTSQSASEHKAAALVQSVNQISVFRAMLELTSEL